MTSEEDFQKALDDNPHDHHTRLVLADFLQDRDDPRAEDAAALAFSNLPPERRVELLRG